MAQEPNASETSAPEESSNAATPKEGDTANSVAEAERLLDEAEQALAAADEAASTKPTEFRLEELIGEGEPHEKVSIELLNDVNLDLKIELGRTRMSLEDILQLRKGSVVTLDKLAGDPVDIFVNGRHVARGEVLVLNDNFCVRVAELVTYE